MPRPRAARPTSRDVARRAGVSTGTVSHVLNGSRSVSVARRAAVLGAVDALGYHPDGAARALRGGPSRVVGLCVPLTTSAYFAALVEAFEEVAAERGFAVMQVLSRQEPALELRRVRALLARRIDGLIAIPSLDATALFDLVAAARVPTVVVDRAFGDPRFDEVGIDDRATMAEAARSLVARGHRRLLYVVNDVRIATTHARMAGLADATRAGGASAETIERGEDEARFAAALALKLRGPRAPTAIVASNSVATLWTLAALRGARLAVPRDVSLLAFEHSPWAALVEPPLATVRQPVDAIARRAWELLMRRIDGDDGPAARIRLPAEIAWRGSVAPPPRNRSAR